MKAHRQLSDSGPVVTLDDWSDPDTFVDPIRQATIARSEANILLWMTYLPEDCITRMIEMQWDLTT